MGFSAGGHLAATLGTHFKKALIPNKPAINLRPDFMVLGYPVVTVPDSLSRVDRMLLGPAASSKKIKQYLEGFAVTAQTPPTFFVHAKDDKTVDVRYSTTFYEKLQKIGVPTEIYLYDQGGHGFGLNNKTSDKKWTGRLQAWMKKQHLLD